MKKLLILISLFLMTGCCLIALSRSASRRERELQVNQTAWQTQTQQLAEIQAEAAILKVKISERKQELRDIVPVSAVEPELAKLLLKQDYKQASPELQDRLLASFGRGGNSANGYVLVSKAALANAHLKPLKEFPDTGKLTDEVRDVLAITADEQQAVESAFSGAFGEIGVWVKDNVQRDGAAGDMLVRYTIPASDGFEEAMTNRLFSSISSAVGNERGELLRNFIEHYRLYEDGGIGDRTNILSVHRIAVPPGYGSRSGWRWADRSEAINTDPEPIKAGRFPSAFRFLFPGGWQELAEREGFELPDEFKKN